MQATKRKFRIVGKVVAKLTEQKKLAQKRAFFKMSDETLNSVVSSMTSLLDAELQLAEDVRVPEDAIRMMAKVVRTAAYEALRFHRDQEKAKAEEVAEVEFELPGLR